jgi:hypothetical protein
VTEPLQEVAAPRKTTEPVEPTPEIARRNIAFALALLGVALLIAAGSVVVALVYLHYD